ncbi:hypothetical protein JCM10212_000142 [Sporobolomyces blumeae]
MSSLGCRSSTSAANTDPAAHHQPHTTEVHRETSSAASTAPVSTTPSHTSTAPSTTATPAGAEPTSTPAPTESRKPEREASEIAGESHPNPERTESKSGEQPRAEGETVSEEGTSSAQTEYPPQMHAGKAGLGPHYNDGSGIADQIKAKSEILKGKLTHNPELVEQGHKRETGELAQIARQQQDAEAEDPFAKPDDGKAEPKSNDPKAEDVKEDGREAKASAATAGTKSD